MAQDKRRKQSNQKLPQPEKCIYCLTNEATTDDHFIPTTLFPKPRPHNTARTVRACLECNQKFSLDDEYVRSAFAFMLDSTIDPNLRQIVDASKRMFNRNESAGLRTSFVETIQPVRLVYSDGSPSKNAFQISVDTNRLIAFTNRVIRALYYIEKGSPLAKNASVWSAFVSPATRGEDPNEYRHYVETLKILPGKSIGGNVFRYKFKLFRSPRDMSMWMLNFYNVALVVGATFPEGITPENRRFWDIQV